MKRKYFADCLTVQQLKRKYHELLKINHTDNGGDLRVVQEIIAEYEILKKILPDVELDENQQDPAASTENTGEMSDVLRNVLSKTETIPDIHVELCGKWIWVSGNTYPVKNRLKELGYMFSSKKKMWYFREQTETHIKYRKHKDTDISEIRQKYGSKTYHKSTPSLA